MSIEDIEVVEVVLPGGFPGPQGDTGLTGLTGPQGPQGAIGPQGNPGSASGPFVNVVQMYGYEGTAFTYDVRLGGNPGDILYMSKNSAGYWATLRWSGKDIIFQGAGLDGYVVFGITGSDTDFKFGRDVEQPFIFATDKLFIGSGEAARWFSSSSAPPGSGYHAAGDRLINSAPAVGQPKGWICTVAGNPGTWVSEGNL